MGFWNSLGDAFLAASEQAILRFGATLQLGEMSDRDILEKFNQIEDYLYYYDEDKEDDEYKQILQLKKAMENILKARGYRPKTTWIMDK